MVCKAVKETRKPSYACNRIRIVTYVLPDVFCAIESKRGLLSQSSYVERILSKHLTGENV